LPLGVIVTIESGSALAGLGSAIAVVLVGLLVCNKDIIREYKESKRASAKK
jgi:transketolase C-terminal domain/subunit